MIQYREWARKKDNSDGWTISATPYKFEGWFLFGFIPLYVRRIGV
jgi:hypothetical protein